MIPSRGTIILLLLVAIVLTAAGCLVLINGKDNIINIPLHPITSPTTPVKPTLSVYDVPSIYWIKIEPISDKQVGEIFTVNSTTNLSVGEEILVQVYENSFHHSMPGYTEEFSGGVGFVKVITGRNGTNTISFIINSTAFNLDPDEYLITEAAINENVTAYEVFNITPKKTTRTIKSTS